MNPKHNLLPATLDILTLTLEISPSTLDKNLHSEIEISINQCTEHMFSYTLLNVSFILKLTFRRKFVGLIYSYAES